MTTDLESKLTEARRALDRARAEAEAKEVQARTERLTKKSIFQQEEDKYEDIDDQIRKCVITAPQDGMVVYYVSEQSRGGYGSQQSIIAQGEPVREGQKLMRIPDLRRMLVNTKVHEAMISRIRGDVWQPTEFVNTMRAAMLFHPDAVSRLVGQNAVPELRERLREHEMRKVADGMKATIRIDAFPERVLQGHVKTVATVSAKQDYSAADVKLYQTMVAIDESLEGLKPDMSAEVIIHIDSTDQPVLAVPLQAIVGGTELGGKRKVYVMSPEGNPQERDVLIGLSNEKQVEIKEGLSEGEVVILNPKVILGDRVKTRQVIENERGNGPGGEGKGKGKGRGGRGKGRPGGPDMMPGGGGGGMPPGSGGMAK
jgi:multidrug efflux pump subunit AcrA (membrane-fusion protein)